MYIPARAGCPVAVLSASVLVCVWAGPRPPGGYAGAGVRPARAGSSPNALPGGRSAALPCGPGRSPSCPSPCCSRAGTVAELRCCHGVKHKPKQNLPRPSPRVVDERLPARLPVVCLRSLRIAPLHKTLSRSQHHSSLQHLTHFCSPTIHFTTLTIPNTTPKHIKVCPHSSRTARLVSEKKTVLSTQPRRQ